MDKLYRTASAWGIDGYEESIGVFASKGRAIDTMLDMFGRDEVMPLREYRVLDMAEGGACLDEDNASKHCIILKQINHSSGFKWDGWITDTVLEKTRELERSAVLPSNVKVPVGSVLKLDTSRYPEPTYPMLVKLGYGNNDTLMCYIKSSPNIDGITRPGKIFFPDKRWSKKEAVFAGYAIVTVRKEMNTCGFLMGEMVKFSSLTLDMLLDHLKSQMASGSTNISYIEHPELGGMYITDQKFKEIEGIGQYVLLPEIDGQKSKIAAIASPLSSEDMQNYIVWSKSMNELQFERAFGDDMLLYRLQSQFRTCEFSPNAHTAKTKLADSWVRLGPPEDDEVLATAVRAGVLIPYTISSAKVTCYDLVPGNMYGLCTMELEGLNALVEKVSQHNEEASQEIRRRLKKGTIKLALVANL